MKKSDSFDIAKSQLKTGIKKALTGSLEIAGYTRDLLESSGNPVLALGLYCFAIEEYGKAELLKDCFMEQDAKIYKVPKSIFAGKNSHAKRFQKAVDTLPQQSLSFGLEDSLVSSTKQSTQDASTNPGASGSQEENDKDHTISNILAKLQASLECFYLEWNEQTAKWSAPPKIKPEKLLESVYSFEKHTSARLDSEYQ